MNREPDISGINVRYVADLARIDVSADEAAQFETELDDVLKYVQKLAELDLDGVEPMDHVIPLANVMRDDVPQIGMERDVMLANAPATADNAFVRVPAVIDDEGIS